ncbi:MAG: hypothetical protein ACM3XZ_10990 [Betaproteobacteria bacterium]
MRRIYWIVLGTVVLAAGILMGGAALAAPGPRGAAADRYSGCCGGVNDGWLLGALQSVDREELQRAFGDLEKKEDAQVLMNSQEAVTIRKIVETGKIPEMSLEDFRKLEQSPRTIKLLRALFGLVRVDRYLTT